MNPKSVVFYEKIETISTCLQCVMQGQQGGKGLASQRLHLNYVACFSLSLERCTNENSRDQNKKKCGQTEGGISNKMGKDILFMSQHDLFLRACCIFHVIKSLLGLFFL